MSSNQFLVNRHHNIYEGNDLRFKVFTIKDCSMKKKEYEPYKGDSLPKDLPNLGYVEIYSGSHSIVVTTPTMICPFGFNKSTGQIPLQFTNVTTDSEMNSFFSFIQELEFKQMKYLGLTDEETEQYISQIRIDKQERYDPNLSAKVPFQANRYEVDIRCEDSDCSVARIYSFSKLKCDIYIDKIWKFNDRYICKWKVKKILIL